MLTFTNPSALLALLGLLVPLAIHLWNRRPGREVAVGSLRWLAAGANRRLRNLRLEQLWLLLLRATLLAVLAGAVAGLAWRQPLPAGRGQLLVSPDLMGKGVLAAVRPRIDSLRRRGYALRWLSRGLPLLPTAAWQADSLGQPLPTTSSVAVTDADFYEQRIRQAADTFTGQPLYVLTSARLTAMQGSHRSLPPSITWQTLLLPTESTWLQAATSTTDSLHLLLGHSSERQTTFSLARAARPQAGQSVEPPGSLPLRYRLNNNKLQPLLSSTDSGQTQSAVPVQLAALRVWVYAPPAYAAEAHYLRAALQAASVGLPGPLVLTVAPKLPPSNNATDWLFWLPATPAPAAWREQVRQGLHLWQAPPGPGTPDTTLLIALGLADEAPATIWQRMALPSSTDTEALWTDAQGQPVLTRQAFGQGTSYHFASRLNPAWSTLADNPALPALLLNVLQPAPTGTALARLRTHDQRRLDASQLPASGQRAGSSVVPPTFRLLDLRPWLLLLAGVLLALERWLASRRESATSLLPA